MELFTRRAVMSAMFEEMMQKGEELLDEGEFKKAIE